MSPLDDKIFGKLHQEMTREMQLGLVDAEGLHEAFALMWRAIDVGCAALTPHLITGSFARVGLYPWNPRLIRARTTTILEGAQAQGGADFVSASNAAQAVIRVRDARRRTARAGVSVGLAASRSAPVPVWQLIDAAKREADAKAARASAKAAYAAAKRSATAKKKLERGAARGWSAIRGFVESTKKVRREEKRKRDRAARAQALDGRRRERAARQAAIEAARRCRLCGAKWTPRAPDMSAIVCSSCDKYWCCDSHSGALALVEQHESGCKK